MFRRSVAVGLFTAACLPACSSVEPVSVGVAPTILFPRGLLDNVTKLTLTVIDGTKSSVDCDASSGQPTGDTSKPILTKDLSSTGCANGAKFCGDVQVPESSDTIVFAAAGYDATSTQIATGCAKATVNQDALPLQIQMKRAIAPSVCGDGVIQPTEQCDPAGGDTDPVCDAQCHTKEIYLSGGNASTGTSSGTAGDKKNPTFVWPAASGDGGRFVALFSDASQASTKVTMRVLSDNLEPYTKQGAAIQNYSFFMPHDPAEAGQPPSPGPNSQLAPSAASVGGNYYVAFQDDSVDLADVFLRSSDSIFTSQQASALQVNDGTTTGKQVLPSMAANSAGTLLIAWEDDNAGVINARTYNPTGGVFGTTHLVSTAPGNAAPVAPVLASAGAGWVCVWQSGSDIYYRTFGADGTLLSAPQKVNDATHSGGLQTHPWVAGLSDGRFAIVWNDRTGQGTLPDIFLQRFSASAQPVAGDQASPLNNLITTGDQNAPTIAASSAAGGSFVAAWADGSTGHIRARLIGGTSDFLFDNIDGQSDEFQASVTDGRTRANPTAAVGGSGPFVTIGWEDNTKDPNEGIYTRRFPLPSN